MSDIHGLYDRYQKMLKKIEFSDDDFLYVLGDVIDRGPDGIEILQDIMARDNVELFLGNHEHMMLTFLDGSDTESWFYGVNGGEKTYTAFLKLEESERERIVTYLQKNTTLIRKLHIGDHHYVLSHTGALSDIELMYTRDFKGNLMAMQPVVWNMLHDSTDNIAYKEQSEVPVTLISGHIITRRLWDKDEVYIAEYANGYTWMDIDCGCAMGENYGALSCLKINDEGVICDIFYVT